MKGSSSGTDSAAKSESKFPAVPLVRSHGPAQAGGAEAARSPGGLELHGPSWQGRDFCSSSRRGASNPSQGSAGLIQAVFAELCPPARPTAGRALLPLVPQERGEMELASSGMQGKRDNPAQAQAPDGRCYSRAGSSRTGGKNLPAPSCELGRGQRDVFWALLPPPLPPPQVALPLLLKQDQSTKPEPEFPRSRG